MTTAIVVVTEGVTEGMTGEILEERIEEMIEEMIEERIEEKIGEMIGGITAGAVAVIAMKATEAAAIEMNIVRGWDLAVGRKGIHLKFANMRRTAETRKWEDATGNTTECIFHQVVT